MRLIRFVLCALLGLALFVHVRAAFAEGPMDGLAPAPSLDRGSPRRAFEGFLHAGSRGDFLQAAHYLDLRAIPKARQSVDGPVVAEKLWYVTTHVGDFDVAKIPDDADAAVAKGDSALEVGTLAVRDGPVPIGMTRVKFPDGAERWIIAKSAVAVAPTLYAAIGRPTLGDRLPAWLRVSFAGNALWQWLAVIALVLVAYVLARLVSFVAMHALLVLARRTPTPVDDALVTALRQPARLAIVALLLDAGIGPLQFTTAIADAFEHIAFTLMVLAGAWAASRAIGTIAHGVESAMPGGPEAEMLRRRVRTRLAIFQRLAVVLVIVVAVALTLLQFEAVRAVGVSLLASAGLAGIVFGFAAQRSLGAIVSGIQLSITQPIRIGDAVVVENEFGTIESIYLTHVVVALWDERRLILPVSRFIEQPFQNWSRAKDTLIGTVVLPVDFAVPVAALRAELRRICEASPSWDRRDCGLQVTDVTDKSMVVRALVSAPTPGALWDLRCEVREKLMEFVLALQEGRFLPQTRFARVDHGGAPASGREPNENGTARRRQVG